MNPNNWQGFKELVLVNIVDECESIKSFYFEAKDGSNLVKHIPGQFITFKLNTDDPKYKDVMRAYSLSNLPSEKTYRVSVKKVDNGLISCYLFDNLKIGDSIYSMSPRGKFIPADSPKDEPMILLGGGIGITPVLSMLYSEAENKGENLYFIQAVQHSNLQPFKQDIEDIAKTKKIKNIVFYSNPLENDIKGKNYDYLGFVTKEWIEDNLPLNGHFYFCGPKIFIDTLKESLTSLGVPKEKIHFEIF